MPTVTTGADRRTPDERAEAIIGAVLAGDVVAQQELVRRRRIALALGRRHPRDEREELDKLQWALDAAERYLAVVDRRQADWHRDRAFDRDLVERVLLMARLADFRDPAPRARDAQPPATEAAPPAVSTVSAVIGYLRKHHPPTD